MPRRHVSNSNSNSNLADVLAPVGAAVALVATLVATLRQRPADERLGHSGDGDAEPADEPTEQAPATGIKARLAALGDRWPWFGTVLAVFTRYGELHGNNLAASIAFAAFVSLFPLLLVVLGVAGFVAAGSSTDIAGRVIRELGLNGDAARAVRDALSAAEDSRQATSVVGLALLLWSGLGLVAGLQYGFDQVWQVKERGVKDKAVGILWLAGAALLFVGAAAVTTLLRWLPGVLAPIGILVGLVVNFALWLWTSKMLPNRDVGWRPLLLGAIAGALGLEGLKVLGAIWVPRAVESSSQLYGSLGVVFAILAWLLFFGRLVIWTSVLDVVLYEKDRGTETATIEVPADARATGQVSRSGQAREPMAA